MKINESGITFSYYGDEMLWIWPWKRKNKRKFISELYADSFTNLRDYWEYVGAYNEAFRKEKIIGFSEDEAFAMWAKQTFRHSIVLILRHVNVEMKTTRFWKSLDSLRRNYLLTDYPILFFPNYKQAKVVAESIAPEFAEVFLFERGELLYSNVEKYEIDPRQPGEESYSNDL